MEGGLPSRRRSLDISAGLSPLSLHLRALVGQAVSPLQASEARQRRDAIPPQVNNLPHNFCRIPDSEKTMRHYAESVRHVINHRGRGYGFVGAPVGAPF